MTESTPQPQLRFVPGVPPETVKGWPGMDYSETTDAGMRIQRNVTVPMRDGKLLRVDLYRPDHADGPLPVLIAWSPYGKHGQLDWRYWPGDDVPTEDLSPYTCFETPDPAYWTRHGYAVIMADARGTWGSEGNVTMGGPAEAEGLLRPHRVGRHPGLEQRQGRHGGRLLVRRHPVGGSRPPAPAPRRDQPLGGLERPVLRGRSPRRHPRDRVRADAGHRSWLSPTRVEDVAANGWSTPSTTTTGRARVRPRRRSSAGLRRRQLVRPRAAHPRHARGLPTHASSSRSGSRSTGARSGRTTTPGQRRADRRRSSTASSRMSPTRSTDVVPRAASRSANDGQRRIRPRRRRVAAHPDRVRAKSLSAMRVAAHSTTKRRQSRQP